MIPMYCRYRVVAEKKRNDSNNLSLEPSGRLQFLVNKRKIYSI
jgi:hypothetical protein